MSKLLLIIDMQNDFVTGVLGSKEAQAIVKPMITYAQHFDGDIGFTFDTHKDDYLDTLEGKYLPVPHCIEGTPGQALADDKLFEAAISIARQVSIYHKDRFADTAILKDSAFANADEIYLCGVCTDICVVSNALCLKSLYPDKKIILLKDLCAGTSKEAHEAAIKVCQSCQVEVA